MLYCLKYFYAISHFCNTKTYSCISYCYLTGIILCCCFFLNIVFLHRYCIGCCACFPFDSITFVALKGHNFIFYQGDSCSNMNYLKMSCIICTGYVYLQLLGLFAGRHVGDCSLFCCHVHSVSGGVAYICPCSS